jgi:putative ABC transport system ATP-binding protein
MDNKNLFQLNNLTKAYQKGDNQLLALNLEKLEIYESEILSIVGRSGSGKSTLLNLIGGLDKPTEGNILYQNKNLAAFTQTELANYRKFQIGMIFQSFNLITSYTALDNVIIALTFGGYARAQRKAKAKDLLNMVGLSERIHHKPSELSGGEAQRVAIARALANNPKVILADEPTGNLDTTTSEEIIKLLQQLNEKHGITIVLVTHDQGIAEKISNRYIRLVDGRIVELKSLHT